MITIMLMVLILPKSKKISNRETGEYVYFRKVEISGVAFFVSLLIWFHFQGSYLSDFISTNA